MTYNLFKSPKHYNWLEQNKKYKIHNTLTHGGRGLCPIKTDISHRWKKTDCLGNKAELQIAEK